MIKFTEKIVQNTHEIMNSSYFNDTFKITAASFTRNRNIGFKEILGMCLNFIKKSLRFEIDNYMELTDPTVEKPITNWNNYTFYSSANVRKSPYYAISVFYVSPLLGFKRSFLRE